jgi:hypothetical protein
MPKLTPRSNAYYIRVMVPRALWDRFIAEVCEQSAKRGQIISSAAVVRAALEEYLTTRGR